MTEKAATQVSRQLDKRGTGLGLRLGVKKSGCTGFAYVVDYADTINDDDRVFEHYSVKLVVQENDLITLNGTTVDFGREGLGEAFKFDNPNITAMCGCGESFAVKE